MSTNLTALKTKPELPTLTDGRLENVSGATSDTQIAALWLAVKGNKSSNTLRSYRKELNRFFLWLKYHDMKIRDLNIVTAQRYLMDLGREHALPSAWLKENGTTLFSSTAAEEVSWLPVSERTAAYSRRILTSFLAYACDAGFIGRNPMKLTASPAPVDPRTDMGSVENYLSPATWGWVSKTLEDRTDTPEGARDFWLMMLLYHTGIRREEAAAATVSDIIPDRMTGVPRLKVNGKGGKLRFVTLTETCVRALEDYMSKRPDAEGLADTGSLPLIGRLRGRGGSRVSPRFIGMMIEGIKKKLLPDAPAAFYPEIEAMTTHWMRHTNATHRLAAGASLTSTQDELGHGSIETTRIYARDTIEKRRTDAEKLNRLDASLRKGQR